MLRGVSRVAEVQQHLPRSHDRSLGRADEGLQKSDLLLGTADEDFAIVVHGGFMSKDMGSTPFESAGSRVLTKFGIVDYVDSCHPESVAAGSSGGTLHRGPEGAVDGNPTAPIFFSDALEVAVTLTLGWVHSTTQGARGAMSHRNARPPPLGPTSG
jgi:hypothetical protein